MYRKMLERDKHLVVFAEKGDTINLITKINLKQLILMLTRQNRQFKLLEVWYNKI